MTINSGNEASVPNRPIRKAQQGTRSGLRSSAYAGAGSDCRARLGGALRAGIPDGIEPAVFLAFVDGTGLLQHGDRPAAQRADRRGLFPVISIEMSPAERNPWTIGSFPPVSTGQGFRSQEPPACPRVPLDCGERGPSGGYFAAAVQGVAARRAGEIRNPVSKALFSW
jgi:hypothetical protein